MSDESIDTRMASTLSSRSLLVFKSSSKLSLFVLLFKTNILKPFFLKKTSLDLFLL